MELDQTFVFFTRTLAEILRLVIHATMYSGKFLREKIITDSEVLGYLQSFLHEIWACASSTPTYFCHVHQSCYGNDHRLFLVTSCYGMISFTVVAKSGRRYPSGDCGQLGLVINKVGSTFAFTQEVNNWS